MTKKKDADIEKIEEAFIHHGWKKSSYEYYKYMDDQKKFVVGATIAGGPKVKNNTSFFIDMRFYSIDLNELSCYIWGYGEDQSQQRGLFKGRKLPISQLLHGDCICNLFAIKERIYLNDGGAENLLIECTQKSNEIFSKYKDIDNLISMHDQPNKYNGSAMVMYLFKGNYRKVREMLIQDEVYPPSTGDVKRGLWNYMEDNNLR